MRNHVDGSRSRCATGTRRTGSSRSIIILKIEEKQKHIPSECAFVFNAEAYHSPKQSEKTFLEKNKNLKS